MGKIAEIQKVYPKDLSGLRFGRIVVISRGDDYVKPNAKREVRWKCLCDCGNQTLVRRAHLILGNSKSCGDGKHWSRRKGKDSFAWKGGKIKHRGYVLVYSSEHPNRDKNGYVTEHRLAMETVVGRHLLPEETVHHINGVKDDNRPENLELWSSRHPKGQRVKDIDIYSCKDPRLWESVYA